jgi:hypothetical protein
MSVKKDKQIEYWIQVIEELVEDINDRRSSRVKLDAARDLETQIHERIDAENLDDDYVRDVITRVNNLIEILKKRID